MVFSLGERRVTGWFSVACDGRAYLAVHDPADAMDGGDVAALAGSGVRGRASAPEEADERAQACQAAVAAVIR